MQDILQCKDLAKLSSVLDVQLRVTSLSGARVWLCKYDNSSFILKVIQRKNGKPSKYTDEVTAELEMLKYIKKHIIDTGASPCFIELLYDATCEPARLSTDDSAVAGKSINYQKLYSDFVAYQQRHQDGKMGRRVSLIALEYAQISLNQYLNWVVDDALGEMNVRVFLFMIIHALRVLEIGLPETRHRDLHPDNIMIKFVADWSVPVDGSYNVFTIGDESWIVPFYGAFPKIIDFGGIISPELGMRSEMEELPLSTQHIRNDMQWLLGFVYNVASINGLSRIVGLVNALDPRMHHTNILPRGAESEEFPSLNDMLHSEVFAPFTNNDVLQKTGINIYQRYEINTGTGSAAGANAAHHSRRASARK